jgi:hypothetical protein
MSYEFLYLLPLDTDEHEEELWYLVPLAIYVGLWEQYNL